MFIQDVHQELVLLHVDLVQKIKEEVLDQTIQQEEEEKLLDSLVNDIYRIFALIDYPVTHIHTVHYNNLKN